MTTTISIERTRAGIAFELAHEGRRSRYEALDIPVAKALLTRWIINEVACATFFGRTQGRTFTRCSSAASCK